MRLRSGLKRIFPLLLLVGSLFAPMHVVRAQEAAARTQGTREGSPQAESPQANQEVQDENDAYRHSPMVQKLGRMMGMSTETAATAFEVFNFAILAFALVYVLAKTLPKTFRDRTSAIQKHLVDARTATEEASARLNSVEERSGEAGRPDRRDARSGREGRGRRGAPDSSRASRKRRRALWRRRRQEIASASLLAQRQLQKYAAELAIEQAGRKLVVSAETDRLLVQQFARRLGADENKGGQN